MSAADDFALYIAAQTACVALWLTYRYRGTQRNADRRADAAKDGARNG